MSIENFSHFLHVVVFALIFGGEFSALYANREIDRPQTDASVFRTILRMKRWGDASTAVLLVLFLPLGVQIATDIGVYTLAAPRWLAATWAVGLGWLAIAVLSEGSGRSRVARRIYNIEIAVRVVIGLGCIFDAVGGFMRTGMIQTNWLALKILLFGFVLIVSAWMRSQSHALRFGQFSPTTQDINSDVEITELHGARIALNKTRWGGYAILAMLAVAAWMGVTKSW